MLSFSYSGPKRNGWTYDAHGNVLVDPANGISVEWNVLGLPRQLAAGDSATHRTYLADGTLKQISDGTASRLYLGDMVFDHSSGTISLESAGWEGGRLLPGTGNDKILYQVTDHLGSVRVLKDGAGAIVQRFDYYPFGSVSRNWSSSTNPSQSTLRYRFSGKEVAGQSIAVSPITSALTGTPTASVGTPYLDFGARLYDSRSAAWLSQDPIAEMYYGIGPTVYCAGNPVNLVDPNGMWIPTFQGHLMAEDGDSVESLAEFLGCSLEMAFILLQSHGFIGEDGLLNMSIGSDILRLDNPFTQSIANSPGDMTTDKALYLKRIGQKVQGAYEDFYNCWGSAIFGALGKEIRRGVGIPSPTMFDIKLIINFLPIQETEAVFGKTIIRFADLNNKAQHGVVYYGKSKNGTI